ncbi:CYTH and CHAD domain-containing protein [Variovorax sp. OV329]|uniref:CYTH and CHAD domain-containing protein n=1 Tax=Variovorax sp. OV329 TaxID=1882825 RepID=UPI0008DFA6E2|nr:CYTH and CHAD domain-containing protein [Variovorax sp. OV329]SFN03574.1 adenylate cyclase [Variovorax sp. OV329]
MTEIEFKFQIPKARLAGLQKELARAKTSRTHLQARYFDTADGLLAKNGAALRLRKEGRRWVQTAKALGDSAVHRLEHNVDLGLSRAGVPVLVDAKRHQGTPVGEVLDKLLRGGEVPLVETFATDIWRVTRHARLGRSTVELALDTGRVIAPAAGGRPERVSPVCELELELVQGDVADLVEMARRWSHRHGLWFSTVTKAERGERVRAAQQSGKDEEAVQAVKATPPRFGRAEEDRKGGLMVGAAQLQRAVVAACLAQILPNASEIASGNEAPELIHQLRVGIRRLRSALRELDAVAPGRFDTAAWEPVLVSAFRGLGAQRDRDVLEARMQPQLQALGAPLAELPPAEHTAQLPTAGELVRDAAFQQLLVTLIGFSAPPEVATAVTREEAAAVRKAVGERLDKLHRQLRKAGKNFEGLATDEQHRARKRLKRLRYLAEFVAPLYGKDKAQRYIEQLLPAQDALGDYNDDVVATEAFREATEKDPRAWFAVGWLSAQTPRQARSCGEALQLLAKAGKFWK